MEFCRSRGKESAIRETVEATSVVVGAYFDLLDDAAHVLMLILDRIFDDHDVTGFTAVDVVDERSERGGFAGTRGAADENEAAGEMRQQFD